VSAIRVGYHLGRGDWKSAKRSSWLVMYFITVVNVVMAIVFLAPYLRDKILTIATDDEAVVDLVSSEGGRRDGAPYHSNRATKSSHNSFSDIIF
jgi:hypothetical protein